MSKKIIYVYTQPPQRNYGCSMFLLDAILLVATCGLWLFVIIWRDTRR